MESAAQLIGGIIVVSVFLAGWLACGLFTSRIFKRKKRDPFHGWIVGLVLGPWGVLIAAVLRPQAPEVMRTVQCPHCHAYQDVPAWVTLLDCNQCEHEIEVPPDEKLGTHDRANFAETSGDPKPTEGPMDFMFDPRFRCHYTLGHRAIPDLVAEEGPAFVQRLMTVEGGGFLAEVWRRLATEGGFDPALREEDFSVLGPMQDRKLCLVSDGDRRWAVVFLKMPEVMAPGESEVGTFVWDINAGTVRYFTLEVPMFPAGSVDRLRILCEWSKGNHINYGPVAAADYAQLRDLVLQVVMSGGQAALISSSPSTTDMDAGTAPATDGSPGRPTP